MKLGEILSPGENSDINITVITLPGLLSTPVLINDTSKSVA